VAILSIIRNGGGRHVGFLKLQSTNRSNCGTRRKCRIAKQNHDRTILVHTSVYPAEGRPAPHLSAPLFSRLRRSPLGASVAFETNRIECYGRRPQARKAIAQSSVRGPCGLSQSGHFAPFSKFLHIKRQNFRMYFSVHVCL